MLVETSAKAASSTAIKVQPLFSLFSLLRLLIQCVVCQSHAQVGGFTRCRKLLNTWLAKCVYNEDAAAASSASSSAPASSAPTPGPGVPTNYRGKPRGS
jgi:hypothetical protein